MQGGLGVSRWWVVVLAPIALALMVLGASPVLPADAQTAEPTFVWQVPHNVRGVCGTGNANDNCLHVDPIEQQFIYYPDKRTPGATPIRAKVRDMEVTQQRVSWKWNDASRSTYIWGHVDRVRKTVRMTLWRREKNGVAQSHLFSSGTPRTLPLANDPRIIAQDNRFVPNRLIISRGQQVNFQNKMRVPMAIRFNDGPGGTEPSNPSLCRTTPSDPACWNFRADFCFVASMPRCELAPNRIAVPFPVRPAVLPPPAPDADPPVFWRVGNHFYSCTIHGFNGVITVRED